MKRKVEVRRLGIEMDITENEAFEVLAALRNVFGWAGTEFTRADIETTIDRELTDEEWDAVQMNYWWDTRLAEISTEQGWWAIDEVISDLNLASEVPS